jgi:hypothetical protein
MTVGVSAVMIAYNNEYKALIRLTRDLMPALRAFDAELIVIDNSTQPCHWLAEAVARSRVDHHHYCWQNGDNLMYGPAMNVAVKLATHPYLVYVCTNHGRSYDRTWLADLLAPLLADDTVAMTGTLAGAGSPTSMGFDASLPNIHVQGGVFGARLEALRTHPYPNGQHAHWGADIYQCFALQAAGHKLVNVPTVHSVWRAKAGTGTWKYVHEDDDA